MHLEQFNHNYVNHQAISMVIEFIIMDIEFIIMVTKSISHMEFNE